MPELLQAYRPRTEKESPRGFDALDREVFVRDYPEKGQETYCGYYLARDNNVLLTLPGNKRGQTTP